ncbi:MAG: putative porin [Steroidobacteraceae bacterium]
MRTPVALAVGALLVAPALARQAPAATTIDDLRRDLEALTQRLERVEAENAYLKDNAKASDWASKIRLKGDFRYRHEQIEDERAGGATNDRVRHRVRVRLGVEAKVNDTVKAVVQFATAGDDRDPRSTNQTLGEGATRKGLGLDLAYADWAPVQGINVQLGKIPYAWQRVGSHFWDGDITWEGGAAKVARGPFFGSAFGAWLSESGSGADANLFGGQFGFKSKIGEKLGLTAALGYFDVGGVQDEVTLTSATPACAANNLFFGGAQGNRTEVVGGCRRLRDDYNMIEALAQVDLAIGKLPVAVFADYIRNQDALDNDTGYSFGVTLGKASAARSWEISWIYQDMEQNAQFGQFVDSDFGGGITWSKGSVIKAAWVPAKNWTVNGTYFLNQRVLAGAAAVTETWRDYDRLQLDLNFKF